jgi:hypothetical protein
VTELRRPGPVWSTANGRHGWSLHISHPAQPAPADPRGCRAPPGLLPRENKTWVGRRGRTGVALAPATAIGKRLLGPAAPHAVDGAGRQAAARLGARARPTPSPPFEAGRGACREAPARADRRVPPRRRWCHGAEAVPTARCARARNSRCVVPAAAVACKGEGKAARLAARARSIGSDRARPCRRAAAALTAPGPPPGRSTLLELNGKTRSKFCQPIDATMDHGKCCVDHRRGRRRNEVRIIACHGNARGSKCDALIAAVMSAHGHDERMALAPILNSTAAKRKATQVSGYESFGSNSDFKFTRRGSGSEFFKI